VSERIPSGRELRQRLERLDPDVRGHIAHEVARGRQLREREWAALAVGIARIRRREALSTILLAPVLVFLILLLGTVGGRWARGADPWAVARTVITWHEGLPWLGLAVGLTGLLLLATVRYRRRLRRAERLNLERAAEG